MRRINGKEDLDDEEILNYYLNKLQEVGGESMAHYQTGIAVVDNKGKTYAITIDETPFLMTTKKSNNDFISGGILDLISYDLECKKYFNELNEEEKNNRYKVLDLGEYYFHDDKIDENYDSKTQVAKIRNRAIEFKLKKNQKVIRLVATKEFKNFMAKPEGKLRLGLVTHTTSKKKKK